MEQIAKALIAVQGELRAVPKDAKGYNYRYQSLDDILNMVRPILTKNNLVLFQQVIIPQQPGNIALRTTIMHESGESLSDVAEIPIPSGKGMNEAQQAGSAITYLRRYSISPLLGIVSEDDDDAASVQPKQKQPTQSTPPPEPAKVAAPKQDSSTSELTDDELVIFEAPLSEFWKATLALIDRYDNVPHAQNAAKKLGFKSTPGKNTKEAKLARVEMYRQIRDHAKATDLEEANQTELPL